MGELFSQDEIDKVIEGIKPYWRDDTSDNLCYSCATYGCWPCEFRSDTVRTKCAFYMPPRIEPDNCGNYVVMQPTSESEENG